MVILSNMSHMRTIVNCKRLIKTPVTILLAAWMIVACVATGHSAARTYSASEIDVVYMSGKWVSCKKGTKKRVNYTGVAHNKNGWWRVKNGVVDFRANGIYQNDYGWWKCTGGKVRFDETGVFKNEYGWWRVEQSKVNFNAYGIYHNQYGWWYVTGGKVDFGYNGLAANEHGVWKVSGGKVEFSQDGLYCFRGVNYVLSDDKVVKASKYLGCRVLFLGDSLYSGYKAHGDAPNKDSLSVPSVACSILGCAYSNKSVAGQLLSNIGIGQSVCGDRLPEVNLFEFDVVVLQAGINDYFRAVSLEEFEESLLQVLGAIEHASLTRIHNCLPPVRVLVRTIGYDFEYPRNNAGMSVKQYNDLIVNCVPEALMLSPYLISGDRSVDSKTYHSYTFDGLHYNVKGTNAAAIDLVEDMVALQRQQ